MDTDKEYIKVTKLIISPDAVAPLKAPLAIEMQYEVLTPIANASWEMVYVADYTQKRVEIPLHATAVMGTLAPGPQGYSHKLDTIPTEGVKEKYLLQVGLLKLTLKANNGADCIASVNMVVQVSKDGSGALVRNIMSPLDE